ncbi:sensor histidine kinase [Paenibacillus oralis]|uniref:histidine kinase n=1 Tax=Paenibacillus oralis TaxID=2490856 RepID=A0A3P3U6M7_9BACL|nr:HAMP domain-containing sensor histidine kinase [Paenibacillus oralis]RRJ66022.1 sensor histidine kinase [Paenibacillus oralis]
MKRHKSVSFKIFMVTSSVLILLSCIMYFTLYFILPSFYLQQKKSDLNHGLAELLQNYPQGDWEAGKERIRAFSMTYNAGVIVKDATGRIIFPTITVAEPLPLERDEMEGQLDPAHLQLSMEFPGDERSSTTNDDAEMIIHNDLSLPGHEREGGYSMSVFASLQPIDEAANMVLKLAPYMMVIIFVIAVGGAYVYSHFFARPLVQMSKVAKRMALLDFSERSSYASEDEIGEISHSLNKLSINLQHSMQELTEANAQLKSDIQRKEEMEAIRREFVATISHELKTPLTAISGQLEAMIHQVGPYRDRGKYLAQSHRIVKQMEKLVYEILEISRLESDSFQPQRTIVSLSKLLDEIIEPIQYYCELNEIALEVRVPRSVAVVGDTQLLAKAISNIIGNAAHYTPKGEGIVVHLSADGRYAKLSVLNTGVHLDEGEIPKLFEAFYRIDKSRSRQTGGSGLGLYIVKKVLDVHQATYTLSNQSNGVEFVVLLPQSEPLA